MSATARRLSLTSPCQQQPSNVHAILTKGRKDLWRAQLPPLLSLQREFLFDPSIQLWTAILPPLALLWGFDSYLGRLLEIIYLKPISLLLRWYAPTQACARSAAANDLLYTAQFVPPSDTASAIAGGIAFIVSAAADLIGLLTSPVKMKKWMQAIQAFLAYLTASGIGDELRESIQKPLLRGRLFCNVKILNDIQEEEDTDRGKRAQDSSLSVEKELQEGCRMMRFATAAYGPGMVKSAVDKHVNHDEIDDEVKAISFHTEIARDDIKLVYAQEGGSLSILRHFIAVDNTHKRVILAIRGTLSISGALVDMQAMDCDYCGVGRAHKGIAEQAHSIWQESGQELLNILQEYPDYDLCITGHSLGAGAACLLQLKIYSEQLVKDDRKVLCFGFAPPPTFCCNGDQPTEAIQKAMDNCVCFVHDNDCVPLLSVSSIRRLADLLDTVDNQTEHWWFWRRSRVFWEWEPIPSDLKEEVSKFIHTKQKTIGESALSIPARVVIWMKKNFAGNFEALACPPSEMAKLNIFMCQDMVSDHLPEQYEDALDILTETQENEETSDK